MAGRQLENLERERRRCFFWDRLDSLGPSGGIISYISVSFCVFGKEWTRKPNQTATTSFRQKRFLQEDNRFSRIWNFLQFGDREEIFLRVTQMNTQSVFKFEYTF